MTNEVALYDKQWADRARQIAATERRASNFITHRGGVFKAGDVEMPELCVVVLSFVPENAYYGANFDPDKLTPPQCFAFGTPGSGDEKGMAPHPAMAGHDCFEPQAEDCASCPMNKFGSADKGKGKACKNTRRLMVIPAGVFSKKKGSRDLDLQLFVGGDVPFEEAEEHLRSADQFAIKVPPTSLDNWRKYVNLCASEFRRPVEGVITRVFIEPMSNGGHRLCFEPIDYLPDAAYPVVSQRAEAAAESLVQPYTPPDADEQPAAQRGLKGLRK